MEINIREIIVEEELEIGGLELDVLKVGGGISGAKEVHIGTDEPTGDEVIWIDPSEEADVIPTKTSELENDSGFITEAPTKVSELENDSKFISAPRISEFSYSATGINIENNTVYRFTNAMSSLALVQPTEIDKLFQSEVVFKSGTTATSLSYDNSIKWSGDDITDNKFIPVANKTYNIIFWFDGFNMNAVARGV